MTQRDQTGGYAATNGLRFNQSTCDAPHPLLEDVRCERLRRHPGKHGAHLDAPSTEMVLEWDEER